MQLFVRSLSYIAIGLLPIITATGCEDNQERELIDFKNKIDEYCKSEAVIFEDYSKSECLHEKIAETRKELENNIDAKIKNINDILNAIFGCYNRIFIKIIHSDLESSNCYAEWVDIDTAIKHLQNKNDDISNHNLNCINEFKNIIEDLKFKLRDIESNLCINEGLENLVENICDYISKTKTELIELYNTIMNIILYNDIKPSISTNTGFIDVFKTQFFRSMKNFNSTS